MVIGFDAANVGRLFGHEDGHQLSQTCLELGPSLSMVEHTVMNIYIECRYQCKYIESHLALRFV